MRTISKVICFWLLIGLKGFTYVVVCKSRKDSALLQARTGGTHIADTWGIFWAALQSVALVWLSRPSAPLPTYGGLILLRECFSPVVPFDYDCKRVSGFQALRSSVSFVSAVFCMTWERISQAFGKSKEWLLVGKEDLSKTSILSPHFHV